ncbi:MAG TPA: aminofutalosine synthase MqnE [Thermoanaerobaculia bacterium]|nr:aminofutalosine synthase MqnE [Thermoanaerobaculia bacterium]
MKAGLEPSSFPLELRSVAGKVRDGERLDAEDALVCFETRHVLHLGRLADVVRRRLHGDIAYYNVNRHISPTNVCVYTYNCKFCSFAALPGEDHAWAMSHDEVYEHAARQAGGIAGAVGGAGDTPAQGGNQVTEFHIVGGLHPELPMSWYEEMLRGLKRRYPDAHLKAFTAIEIGWFAQREKLSIHDVLERLRDAGLGSLPGGGAEIFAADVREVICDGKLDAAEWLEVHRVAHGMGIKSNCTMLYGHVEKPAHKVDHLLRLRALQDETAGFQAFIPLAYHPDNNYMGLRWQTTGLDDLQHIATSRLVLDNVPHIKAYWIMISPKLAQVALRFGADDLDGTVLEENIYQMAGAGSGVAMSREELERLVRDAGLVPVERDTLYRPLRGGDAAPLAPVAPSSGRREDGRSVAGHGGPALSLAPRTAS